MPSPKPHRSPPQGDEADDRQQARVLNRPERPMGYVEPEWISPVARRFLPELLYPRLSPYFEHREFVLFVEARPYAELVRKFPDEQRMYWRGSIWGMTYSARCVEGEEGHHHLSKLRPISPERFREVQAAGWDL